MTTRSKPRITCVPAVVKEHGQVPYGVKKLLVWTMSPLQILASTGPEQFSVQGRQAQLSCGSAVSKQPVCLPES